MLVLGAVLDGLPAMIMLVPVLLPYLATMMATVLLITFWPWLTLIVPNVLGLR